MRRVRAGYGSRYRRRYWRVAGVLYLLALTGAFQHGTLGPVMLVLMVPWCLFLALLATLLVALFPPYGPAELPTSAPSVLEPATGAVTLAERSESVSSSSGPEPWATDPSPAAAWPQAGVVASPAGAPPRRSHRALWAVLGVVLLAVVGVGADTVQANRELDQLVTAARSYEVERAEQNAWANENLPDSTALEADPEGSAATYAKGCGRVAGSLSSAGRAAEDVSVLPWHQSLREAKSALVHYTTADVAVWDACVAAFTDPDGTRAALSRARAEADGACDRFFDTFHDAVPLVSLGNARDRMSSLWPC